MPLIKPIVCPQCNREGWPGENGFQLDSPSSGPSKVHCTCGQVIIIDSPRDYLMLSTNIFVRLLGASNHWENGSVRLIPGHLRIVRFKRPFDLPCKAFVTPAAPIFVTEHSLSRDSVRILSSVFVDDSGTAQHNKPVGVSWIAFGLVDVNTLPTWYILFYGALAHNANGFYKPALLDYATAFEAFVEQFLRKHIAQHHGGRLTNNLLKKMWKIEDRVRYLLELVTQHSLTEEREIYEPWNKCVQTPRNRLMHGQYVAVGKGEAENAHRATYQAIRWIESLPHQ